MGRQIQVLQGMADGLTAREVARALGISKRTVEGHLRTLRELTGARSIGELCALGGAAGWVTPSRQAHVRPVGHGMREGAAVPRVAGSCPGTVPFLNKSISSDRIAPGRMTARGGRPTVMTPERIAAARELLPSHTITEMAGKLGVSRGTLYAHMHVIVSADESV
jgi:DNA-binding CsgD family transcriptional regulator